MKTYELSTSLFPIVNVGTYWGPFEVNRFMENETEREEQEGRIVCDDFDFDKYKASIAAFAEKNLNEFMPLKQFGVVKYHDSKVWSPREYNFMDDRLDFKVDVNDDFLENARKTLIDDEREDMRKAIDEYIEKHWRSCDGFMSYMPQDRESLADILDDVIYDGPCASHQKEYAVGCAMSLLHHLALKGLVGDSYDEESEDEITNSVVEEFSSNVTIGEFCTVVERDAIIEEHELEALVVNFDQVIGKFKEDVSKYLENVNDDKIRKKINRWSKMAESHIESDRESQNWLLGNIACASSKERPSKIADLREWRTGYEDRCQQELNEMYRNGVNK